MAQVTLESIRAARDRVAGHLRQTPCVLSETLSEQLGCPLYIKFENLQFTASFKERGALNCLLANPQRVGQGVIAMSAGNHAQALAYHGRRLGIPTTIVMPRFTPNAKVEATRVFGGEIILEGNDFDETRQFTLDLALERGLHLVHPFDDVNVIAGQGTVGLEILDQVAGFENIIVPVGGGGLISGTACAIKSQRPNVRVIGVQMERYPGAYEGFYGRKVAHTGPGTGTVAEGIAVKSPGENTLAMMREFVDEMHLVDEAAVEQAVFDLLEIEKTVAEGAGAAPLALLRSNRNLTAQQPTVMVLSGGNIDMMILSSVLQRGLVRSKRLVRLQVEIPDTPGALAKLTGLVGQLDSNIIDIEHQRAFAGSSVRATVVELVLQMRGEEQQGDLQAGLTDAGYHVRLVDP